MLRGFLTASQRFNNNSGVIPDPRVLLNTWRRLKIMAITPGGAEIFIYGNFFRKGAKLGQWIYNFNFI